MTEDTHPNAGRDSGYTDEQGRAIGEDLINKVTILIAGVQTSLVGVRADIAELAKQQAKSDRARLNRNTQFQEHIDTRFDAFGDELQAVGGLVREVQTSQSVFQTGVDARITALEVRVTRLEAVNDRLAHIEAILEARGDGT